MGVIKLLTGFLAVAAVVICLFQVVPPIMANFGFQDDLRTIALIDGSNLTKTDDDIRNDVMRKAKEHDLPLDPKQVTVQRINSPGLAAAYVTADYTVTLSLPGYSFDMHFTPNSGNKGF
jgi:hypothetical protein